MNWNNIKAFFNYELIPASDTGSFHLDVWMVIIAIIILISTYIALKLMFRILTRNMEQVEKLKFNTVFKYLNYLIYLVIILLLVSNAGVKIDSIFAASAALFVGIGFALQDFFKDIIAGITLLTDKSLQVNDIVEFDGKVARVFEVKLRSTRMLTREDKVLIIPNHLFINQMIYNYTQNHVKTREFVTVGVAYGSDTRLVEKLLLESVIDKRGVLKSPEPFVLFNDFGESSLDFAIYFFVRDAFTVPRLMSEIRYAIDDAFRQNNITIPFPQRDLHIYGDNKKIDLSKNLGLD